MNSMNTQILLNEQRPCSVAGCPRKRWGVSAYCQRHLMSKRLWGHPLAKQIPSKEYASQVAEVQRLFKTNPDHPGILYAESFISKWIESAAIMGAGPCPARVARYRGIVSPRELLVEVAAVWVYGHDHPERVFDETHLRYLLGNKFLIYGRNVREIRDMPKLPRLVKGKESREAGRLILVEIGDLLNTIYKAVLERRKAQAVKADVQREEFQI